MRAGRRRRSRSATRSSRRTGGRATQARPCVRCSPGPGSKGSRASSRRSRRRTSRRSGSSDGSGSRRSGATGTTRTARSSSSSWSATPGLELALDPALRLAVGDVAALVASLLATGERELDLCTAVFEIEPGRHERQALLGDLGREPVDLATVQEQLAGAVGVVGLGGLLVWRDVEADQPELAVARVGVGALQNRVALPERLDLAPGQREPRLDALEQAVLVPRA